MLSSNYTAAVWWESGNIYQATFVEPQPGIFYVRVTWQRRGRAEASPSLLVGSSRRTLRLASLIIIWLGCDRLDRSEAGSGFHLPGSLEAHSGKGYRDKSQRRFLFQGITWRVCISRVYDALIWQVLHNSLGTTSNLLVSPERVMKYSWGGRWLEPTSMHWDNICRVRMLRLI